jgi:hypothetical protein
LEIAKLRVIAATLSAIAAPPTASAFSATVSCSLAIAPRMTQAEQCQRDVAEARVDRLDPNGVALAKAHPDRDRNNRDREDASDDPEHVDIANVLRPEVTGGKDEEEGHGDDRGDTADRGHGDRQRRVAAREVGEHVGHHSARGSAEQDQPDRELGRKVKQLCDRERQEGRDQCQVQHPDRDPARCHYRETARWGAIA